ncbi:MAG: tetratricopeptide repeat protein [Cyanothece sp. SIO1E1]|nr:tetratricopeptide repeat protein [Cyanothece sp. SIO1E1]
MAIGNDCRWDSAKVTQWEKAGSRALIESYLNEQVNCLKKVDNVSAIPFLKELSATATRSDEPLLKGYVLGQLGLYYRLRKDYPAALYYLLEEISHWASVKDNFEAANALVDVADLYEQAGNFSKAYTCLLEAYRYYQHIGLKGPLATTAARLGFYHKENAQYDSAFFYLEEAKLLQQDINDLEGLVYTLNHLGRIYKDKGQREEANAHYQTALTHAMPLENRRPEAWTLINLGFLALDQSAFAEALPLFEKARRLAETESMREILRLSFEGLYRLAEQEQDFELAFQFYRQYQELSAQYRDNQLASALTETEWRYQQKLLQKELEIDRLARSKDQLWKWLGGVTSVLLLTLLAFSWISFRKKLKEAEREKRDLDLEIEKYAKHNVQLQERIMSVQTDKSSMKWSTIEQLIQEQYPSFKTKLLAKHPKLSEHDLRFCMLLMSSFSTKEIAGYFNISPASANKTRYRLRRKLGLRREENLLRYLLDQM